MSILSALFKGGDLVESVGNSLDSLFTSDEERMEQERELLKAKRQFDVKEQELVAQQNIAQTKVNEAEARSGSFFVAGWRPFIGWIGALALGYQFIAYPILLWFAEGEAPPQMQPDMLYTIITGMLGIAGMRSLDKIKQTDTRQVNKIHK